MAALDPIFKLSVAKRLLILLAIVIIPMGFYGYFSFYPKWEEIGRLENKLKTVQDKIRKNKIKLKSLPKLKEEVKRLEKAFKVALTQLPNKTEMDNLLMNISKLEKESGLISKEFKPGKEKPKEFYAEVPIRVRLKGTFHEIGMFFYKLSQLPRIVNVINFTFKKPTYERGRYVINVDCLLMTYRFIEKRKAQDGKQKGKKKR